MIFSRRSARLSSAAAKGFTLLEIMVVLAILGLLVAVLVRNVGNDLTRGQQSAAKLFVKATMDNSLQQYRIDTGNYPTTAQGLDALINQPQNSPHWRGPYYDSSNGQLPLDPWNNPYEYRFPGTKNKAKYDLFSKGPDGVAETDDDIGNWQ